MNKFVSLSAMLLILISSLLSKSLFSTHFISLSTNNTNNTKYESALNFVEQKKFREALKLLNELLVEDPKNSNLNYLIGICSFYASDEKFASIYYFKKAARKINKNFKFSSEETAAPPQVFLYIAYIYQLYGNYSKAIHYYSRFKKEVDLSKFKEQVIKTDEQITKCQICTQTKKFSTIDFTIEFEKNNIIEFKKIEKEIDEQLSTKEIEKFYPNFDIINSQFSELSLVIMPDSSIVLSSDRPKSDKDVYEEGLCNVYIFPYKNGRLETGSFIKGLNSVANEQITSVSADGKTFYMHSDLDGSYDILISKQQPNGEWSKPVSIGKNINTRNYDELSPFISYDGQTLLFVSLRKDGIGDKDIYYCKRKNDGTWSDPINIGEPINSIYDEETPFLTHDNKILFFSSRGHNSFGGYDVFYSEFIDSMWTKPVNIGKSINTEKNELGYIETLDKKLCFFTRNLGGNRGYDYIKSPRPKIKLFNIFDKDLFANTYLCIGSIIDNDSLPYKTNIVLFDKKANKILIVEENDEFKGNYFLTLEKDVSYSIVIKTDDYLFYSHNDDVSFDDPNVKYIYDKTANKIISNKGTTLKSISKKEIIEKNPSSMSDFEKLLAYIASDTIKYFDSYYDEEYVLEQRLKLDDILPKKVILAENITKNQNKEKSEEKNNNINEKLTSNKLKVSKGDSIHYSNVYFEYNSHELTSEGMKELDRIAEALLENGKLKIEIIGHTDNIGSDSYNLILSEKRAKAVFDYFVSKKIKAERMKYKGMGESKPIATNDTPEGRAKNRRTEIIMK